MLYLNYLRNNEIFQYNNKINFEGHMIKKQLTRSKLRKNLKGNRNKQKRLKQC